MKAVSATMHSNTILSVSSRGKAVTRLHIFKAHFSPRMNSTMKHSRGRGFLLLKQHVFMKHQPLLAHRCSSASAYEELPKFRVHKVTGDGRCLFRSLVQSHHAFKSTEEHGGEKHWAALVQCDETQRADELRESVCKQLLKRKEDIQPFLEEEVGTYVAKMNLPSTWGGEPELVMAAYALDCSISVYSMQIDGDNRVLAKISEYAPDTESVLCSIHILFHGYGHYDALVPE